MTALQTCLHVTSLHCGAQTCAARHIEPSAKRPACDRFSHTLWRLHTYFSPSLNIVWELSSQKNVAAVPYTLLYMYKKKRSHQVCFWNLDWPPQKWLLCSSFAACCITLVEVSYLLLIKNIPRLANGIKKKKRRFRVKQLWPHLMFHLTMQEAVVNTRYELIVDCSDDATFTRPFKSW